MARRFFRSKSRILQQIASEVKASRQEAEKREGVAYVKGSFTKKRRVGGAKKRRKAAR